MPNESGFDYEPPPPPLRDISEETYHALAEQLNLGTDTTSVKIIHSINPEAATSKATPAALSELTDATFLQIAEVNSELLRVILESLTQNPRFEWFNKKPNPKLIDRFAQGFALVAQAYHIESGFGLLYRLESIESASAQRLIGTMIPNIPAEDSNHFLKALSFPQLPETVPNLRRLVSQTAAKGYDKLIETPVYGENILLGGIFGFKLVQQNAAKLIR